MTETDLSFIESTLGIQLPVVYRQFMLAFPVRACMGNADTEIWDNAQALVALNQRVRAGERFSKPWPVHFFAIGDVDGAKTAIDLRFPEAPVWWIDRVFDAAGNCQTHAKFSVWAESYMGDLRQDLLGDDMNPDGEPEELKNARDASVRAEGRCLLYFIAIAVGITAAIVIVLKLWTRMRQ